MSLSGLEIMPTAHFGDWWEGLIGFTVKRNGILNGFNVDIYTLNQQLKMNARIPSVILILLGSTLISLNYPLEPFESDFEGPLVMLFEFVGPLMFVLGSCIFSYQLTYYFKERDWSEIIPNGFLVYSFVAGFVASVLVLIFRSMFNFSTPKNPTPAAF